MSTARTPADTLMGAIKDLVAQSERVARAEVRLTIAKYTNLAQSGARRAGVAFIAAVFGVYALWFVCHAGFLGLSTVFAPWLASLITAGSLSALAAVLGFAAFRMHDVEIESEHQSATERIALLSSPLQGVLHE